MEEVVIKVPARVMDRLADNLVHLTSEIDKRDSERVAHGCLGGEHGYGAHYDNAVFTMRPFYWGDCTCGADDRERAWSEANKHRPECYQSELKARTEAYDRESGYAEAEKRALGDTHEFMSGFDVEEESPLPGVTTMMMTPRTDDAMEAYRAASKKRRDFEDALYHELCKKYGRKYPNGCAVHCTCDYEPNWQAWIKDNGHCDDCELVLPNFKHKASGLTVSWYKYIGRSMEAENVPKDRAALDAIFNECVKSLG